MFKTQQLNAKTTTTKQESDKKTLFNIITYFGVDR